jgi:hypothetical protein
LGKATCHRCEAAAFPSKEPIIMAETQAKIGYGTLVQFSDEASPPMWTTFAEVR